MVTKTKIEKTTETINQAAAQAGIIMMTAAATLGLVHIPHESEKRAVLPSQPAFAVAHVENYHPAGGEDMRRERDEVHPHSHGYGLSQRTASRAGRA